jgi:peptidoglycan/xylan/chitin deacetylase (PgdA/CDA1 family)
MILLAVGYHYVSAAAPRSPRAIFPVTVDALAAQLELLGSAFELVSRDELLAAAAGEGALPERACVVTFDDGLRCQVELALPVLERLGVPATFFLPGRPLAEGRALFVHKVHALRERLDEQVFLRRLQRVLEERGLEAGPVPEDEARAHYRYDTPEAAQVKYLLNMALPREHREPVVTRLFEEVFPDEQAFCRDLYMSPEQVAELERRHRAVGAHGYAHEPLALLAGAELADDLERSVAALEGLTGARPLALSYPHGTPATVDLRVARAAAAAGFRAAFTMERALNRSLEEPLLLGRLDANDAPGGSRPRLELVDGEPVVREGMTAARERYFDERLRAA